jgi:hypothetical protein
VLLLKDDHPPLIVAEAGQVAFVDPVEEFAALVVASGKRIMLVIAVEMNLEDLAVGLVAVQHFSL